ncbi:DUF1080 domain-containing protein, partial [Candidatus Sumerlaeota bacterium]|nr:DUF1080 domain-containing protein [Candidatus Sumerlaeota bacterium]
MQAKFTYEGEQTQMNMRKYQIGHRAPFALFILTVAFSALCPRGLRAEPKMLSQEEAAAGWINLFDGETLFGWNRLGDADFKVAEGNIECESGSGGWLATTSPFADFELVAKIRVKPWTSAGLVIRGGLEGHPSENGSGVITITEPKASDYLIHTVEVTANGSNVSAKVDGKPVEGLKVGRSKGVIGLQYHGAHFGNNRTQGKLDVSEVRLRPLNLKPIFNGKDLTEWNIIPGHKSEFNVVDGAINIKNGNGQIESKGTYKDFVLQLDIFSNGKHLNSGVFYRGPVGVFWKGYESQVRNEWSGEDRTKAVDYGTGGNYGNQPSRKVVSSDKEWFFKTVVCDGN